MRALLPRHLAQARAALAALAEHGPHGGFFAEMAAGSHIPEELPHDVACTGELVYLGSREQLGRRFGPRLTEREHDAVPSPVEALWSVAAALDGDTRAALDVLVRRAVSPFEALATWPLETLFSAAEQERIRAVSAPRPPVRRLPIAWEPARDMRYDGYICSIVKLTRLCNLRCTYCNDWREGPDQTMPFEVQLALFRRLLDETHRVVDVIWHGGEPTVFGRRQFLRVLALQRHFRRPGQQIRNIIQTNAVGMTPVWARFLARYRFRVGVSLDGPERVHDLARIDRRGRGSFARVRRGMRYLREAGVPFKVLLVVGKQLVAMGGAEVLRFLRAEGIASVALLPVHPAAGPVAPGQDYLEHEDFARLLIELQQARKEAPEPWVGIREIDAALALLHGENPRFCELLGNCIGAFYSVEPDGSIGHCDKYIGDPDYTLGNILHDTFDQIRRSERMQALIADNRAAMAKKRTCRHFARCRGWCPHRHYMAVRYARRQGEGCCGLAPLFDALEKEIGECPPLT